MSLEIQLKVGDLVEIIESQGEAGKRGYILRPLHAHDDHRSTDTSIFHVALDKARLGLPPKETMFSSETPARVVNVPVQNLKLVRGHMVDQVIPMKKYMAKEYTCLGMAASLYKVSRINPESPHGRLVRSPAQDLPGLHSCDRSFAIAETGAQFHLLYRGDFTFRWSHSFMPWDSASQDLDSVALERAAPYILIEALPGTIADNHAPMVKLQVAASEESFRYSFPTMPEITESQRISLALRVFHYFVRVAGCDVGVSGLF